MTEENRITMEDVRRVHCVRGIVKWLKDYGFDVRDFIANGLPESQIRQMDDAYAQQIIKMKDEEDGRSRG